MAAVDSFAMEQAGRLKSAQFTPKPLEISVVCCFGQRLYRLNCFNKGMAEESDNSEMWINPISNFGNNSHANTYGESQSSRGRLFANRHQRP